MARALKGPSSKRVVAAILSPTTHDLVVKLAAITGTSKSSIVAQMLDDAAGVMASMITMMQQAQAGALRRPEIALAVLQQEQNRLQMTLDESRSRLASALQQAEEGEGAGV